MYLKISQHTHGAHDFKIFYTNEGSNEFMEINIS